MISESENNKNFSIEELKEEPAESGEVFDPRKELHTILTGPKETHREKFQIFLNKLARQKEGLAETQVKIVSLIEENPDLPPEKLNEKINESVSALGLAGWQRKIIKDIILKYAEKRNVIRRFRNKYPDDIGLFREIFQKKPKGEVSVVEMPIAFCFLLDSPEDFAYVETGAFAEKRNVTESEIEKIKKIEGSFLVKNSLAPALNGSIVIINAADKSPAYREYMELVIDHEKQHIWHNFFTEVSEKEMESVEETEKKALARYLANADIDEAKTILKRYFLNRRVELEMDMGNEILAHLKEGFFADDILNAFIRSKKRGGSYDFYAKNRGDFKDYYDEIFNLMDKKRRPIIKRMAKTIVRDVFVTDYRKLIGEAVGVLNDLLIEGYADDKIIAILQKEPLRKWSKIVARLMEARE